MKKLFLLLLCSLLAAPAGLSAGAAEGSPAKPRDPFLIPPDRPMVLVYKLTGRYEGVENLWLKDRLRVREVRAVDHYLDLERAVELIEIETETEIELLDLAAGQRTLRPNLRHYLSLAWQGLSLQDKLLVAENIKLLAAAIPAATGARFIQVQEGKFLGLPAVSVQADRDKSWFWQGRPVLLGADFTLRVAKWTKTVARLVYDPPENRLAAVLARAERARANLQTQPSPLDQTAWAKETAGRILDLLRQPLVGPGPEPPAPSPAHSPARPSPDRPENPPEKPLAFPYPPGFQQPEERFRVSPLWTPLPQAPEVRPWPASGLNEDIMVDRASQILELLTPPLSE